ncbi:MAG: ATP-binding protein [Spirochaetia bacterium]|nr:ATP-binding protein [Spirochaetia bacterium]MCF7953022.1 ATP-binding protein [Spirochaetales bacterium]
MISRPRYMEKLKKLKDTDLIKVITGIRRCGKSTLLQMYRDYLLSIGVRENQLLSINFEDMDYAELADAVKLHAYIKEKLASNSNQAAVSNSNQAAVSNSNQAAVSNSNQSAVSNSNQSAVSNSNSKNYIFLDEIQNVIDFPKVINSLNTRSDIDLYITGSNAYLLSSELATFLSGRYVEIRMLPLSFKEYLSAIESGQSSMSATSAVMNSFSAKGSGPSSIENFGNERNMRDTGGLHDGIHARRAFNDYVRYSSFPYAVVLRDKPEVLRDYLQGIYSTVLIKDVVTRNSISDVLMLESVVRFLFDRVGNLISIKKIADTMSSAGRKISSHTVEKYIRALLDSFIFYRVGRFDIKGREHLKTLEKYYCADIGLRYLLLGSRAGDIGFVLENIIYLELLRRETEVYVGRIAHNRRKNKLSSNSCSEKNRTVDNQAANNETANNKTPNNETPNNKTPNNETPNIETPNIETANNETANNETANRETPNREIDFVTFDERDESGYTYYQVAATVQDQKTLERELAPLLSLDDHYPKFIITLDEDVPADYRGIKVINALDFLLQS